MSTLRWPVLPLPAPAPRPQAWVLRMRPLHWALYAGFWLVNGLFLSMAELQHYLQRGGRHAWEPFLWELSSTFAAGVLVLAIFTLHQRLFEVDRPAWQRLAAHAAGAVCYVLLHSALMYGVRALVYAATGVGYEPGSTLQVLAYEGAKDVMTYGLIVGLCHGVLLLLRERQRREDWQRLNEELAAARLARLQEQVQPHFLFNALNLVSAVMYEDVERADRLLAELCDLLRLSLEAGRVPVHSLGAELKLLQPFLSIMQQRFEGRLQTQVQVSEAAAGCALPSLLLIAPLENAVKHGLASGGGPLSLVLQATVQDGRLVILVRDHAVGRQSAPAPAAASMPVGLGLGLANARDRLATMYGPRARLDLAREGDSTVLRLDLPAEPAP